MPLLRHIVCLALAVVARAPSPATAQGSAARAGASVSTAAVTWEPERPRQGTVFRLTVRAEAVERITGSVAGEPLHFERVAPTVFVSLAPAPIDSTGSLTAALILERTVGTDTVRAVVPVAVGAYAMERLTVAPRFGARPDSALQRRLDDEARRAREVSRLAHETPRLWSQPFTAPRTSRITSTFGSGREFNGTVTSRHMGTDYAGATGAPVHAANRGVVRLVDRFYLGGNVVYIDHGAGVVTAYLHLSATAVAPGDTVARGQVIGRVGATGRVTGPHLHLIARYGEVTVDPVSLLRLTAKGAREGDRPGRD